MQEKSLDTQLMERVANGDGRAFHSLVELHLPRAHAIARRTLSSREDAEEAIQDTFNKIWVNAKYYNANQASFGTWFYRILTNTCIDMKRKKSPLTQHIDGIEDMLPDTSVPQDITLVEKQEARKIKDAVQALPEKQRMAIILCYYEEITNPEAAKIMGIHIKALEGLLVRARKTLKENIK